jgi:hypothetical protein
MLSPISTTTEASSTASSNKHEWIDQTTTESSSSSSSTSTIASRKLNSEIKNHKSYFRLRKDKTIPTSLHSGGLSRDERHSISSSTSSTSAISDKLNSKDFSATNDDENNLDYGLMTMSAAGDGKASPSPQSEEETSSSKKEEKQKTLSDQIAEGKYGLIEKELFIKTPVRPGIISYKTNSETPQDNEKTLGGLKKEEIWLAEDDLLVLKGGIPNEGNSNEDWKPIDDYEAPKRPVKIPLNPRVPPPFPVQLSDNGPLQFVGHNQFSLFNPLTNETGLFTNDQSNGPTYIPPANGVNTKNSPPGYGSTRNPPKTSIHDVIQPPPWLFYNNKENDLLKQFPFNLPLPDSVLNNTEEFDEDDPSLFYPPPYSFVYKINYTNLAPVGPLVPGIVLPPPPNYFSVYDPEEDKKPVKTPIDVINRIKEIHLKNRLTASSTVTPTSTTIRTPSSSSIRDFTKKTKLTTLTPSSTPYPSTTRLHKTKSSTVRPITTILQSTTPRDDHKTKFTTFDTTTLKLYPVYTPTTGTTKLFSSTTVAPPSSLSPIKPYKQDYGTQHHPIYFEYFDARTANPLKTATFLGGAEFQGSFDGSAIYSPTVSSTLPPITQVYSSDSTRSSHQSKKPKSYYQPQYISSTISPHPSHVDTKFLFVTPKPEIHFGTVIAQPQYPVVTESPINYNAVPVQKPLVLKPVRFEDEIAAIRHTLDYFNSNNNHHHSSNSNKKKKAPKVKAVYEFSFEASKHKDDFQPMLSYDQQKYYSASASKSQQQQQQQPEINLAQLTELINTNGYYPTTTETSMKYYRSKQSATLPAKKNQQPLSETSATPSSMSFGHKLRQQSQSQQQQQQPPTNVNYYVRPIYKEVVSQPQSQKIINYPSYESQQSSSQIDQGYRVNNRNVKYRNPPQNTQQLQQQQQFYGSEIASLINDTAVNYKQPQRPINPYSEFIDVSRFPQSSQQNPQIQNSPPFFAQQTPIHSIYPSYQQQRPISPSQQQQYHHQNPINYVKVYPHVPQINPESVHITFYNRPLDKVEGSF